MVPATQTLDDRLSDSKNKQAGITIPLFAMLIAVFFMIAALVVDHSKEEIAVTNIQRSADAAALAAARRLNGRVDGWWDAKKAAVAAIKRNPIHGANNEALATVALKTGEPAFWDSKVPENILNSVGKGQAPPAYNSGIEGKGAGIDVKVERGLYWRDSNSSTGYSFTSLETDQDGLKGAVPFYYVANAVRVTVSLERLDTIFGGVMGVSFFEKLNRQSIAIMDSELEKTVAPIGIPLCQLLFDTNPNVTSGNHLSPSFNTKSQCERTTYVTEVNARGDAHTALDLSKAPPAPNVVSQSDRRDGLIRAESYERFPYAAYNGGANVCYGQGFVGNSPNCKSLLLYGTLGVPTSAPGGEASASEVINAFTRRTSTAQIGSYFKPLTSLQGFTEDSIRKQLADAISTSGRTFRSAFMAGNSAKPSFPFGRTSRPSTARKKSVVRAPLPDPLNRPPLPVFNGWELTDLNINVPVPEGIYKNKNRMKFQMFDMSEMPRNPGEGTVSTQFNYTNPMCHDENIWHNDPDKANALEVYAMVLAPGLEEYGGDIVRYCDFEKVFVNDGGDSSFSSSKNQRAVAPIADSKPTVVGFVKLNVFDLNFQRLATRPKGVTDPRLQNWKEMRYLNRLYDFSPKMVEQTENTPVYLKGTGALFDGNTWALNFTGNAAFNDIVNNANTLKEKVADHLEDMERWKKIQDELLEKAKQKGKAVCIGKGSYFLPQCRANSARSAREPGSNKGDGAGDGGGDASNDQPIEVDIPEPPDLPPFDANDFRKIPEQWKECFDFDLYDKRIKEIQAIYKGYNPKGGRRMESYVPEESISTSRAQLSREVGESEDEDGGGNSSDDELRNSDSPLANAVSSLVDELEFGIRTKANMHCLPRLKDGEYDANDPDSFQPLHDLKPGIGCGALRGKISCDAKEVSLATGKEINENSPTLVSTED